MLIYTFSLVETVVSKKRPPHQLAASFISIFQAEPCVPRWLKGNAGRVAWRASLAGKARLRGQRERGHAKIRRNELIGVISADLLAA